MYHGQNHIPFIQKHGTPSPLNSIESERRMDLIQAYKDEGEEEKKVGSDEESLPQPVLKKMHVNAAPAVSVKRQVGSTEDSDEIVKYLCIGGKERKGAEI